MRLTREIELLKIVFRPVNKIPLISWSGSFCAKLVYDILSTSGIIIERRASKPFTLSPLHVLKNGSWNILWSGICKGEKCSHIVLDPRNKYFFRIVFFDQILAMKFINSLMNYSGEMNVIELNYNSVKVRPRLKKLSTDRVKALVRIVYETPTHYMFRSWDILYPSHKRLLYSLGRTLYRLTRLSLRMLIERIITRGMELLEDKTKVLKIKIGVNKYAYGFVGEALYGIYLKEYEYRLLKQLLWLGEIVGVGRNRSLGFGVIKTEVKEIHQ